MNAAAEPLNLTRMDAFLQDRRTLSRDQFLQKYATPVLIISLSPEGEGLQDDGGFRTQQITSENTGEALAPLAKRTLVVPVAKTSKDAFQAFIWVGREARCDVSLPFGSVSKLQAQFVKKPSGDFDLMDAGSTNGTFANGVKLEKNKPFTLRDQMKVRFGKVDARFRTAEGFWDETARFL